MKVLIDPYVIAVPPLHSSRNRVLCYVEGVRTWLRATSYPFVKVLYPSKCTCRLIETDQFPFWHNIDKLLSATGIVEYDVQAVSRVTTRLFNSWEDVEKFLRAVAIVGQLTVIPRFFVNRLPQDVSEPFVDYLGRIVLQRSAGDPVLAELCIGSTTDIDNTATKLTIQGTITDVEIDETDLVLGQTPIKLISELPVLLDREDILSCIDWKVIWEYPRWAIEKAYYWVVSSDDRAMYRLGRYAIGCRFLETITDLGLHSQAGRIKSIYETCALVACDRASGISGIKPRPLQGVSARGDGAVPMRANISKRGPGYRLHYWRCRDGGIELSCVNVHNDMTIY